jgi:hypothetical protein
MRIPLRITHTGEVGSVYIQIVRSDVPAGEPHALEAEHILHPGDSTMLQLRARSMIVIAQESLSAKAELAAA